MDKIWDRKSFEVGGHWPLWRGWKKRMTTQNRQKSNAKIKTAWNNPIYKFWNADKYTYTISLYPNHSAPIHKPFCPYTQSQNLLIDKTNPSPFMSSSVKIISIIVAISESLNIFFWIGLSASASVNMVVAKGGNY